MRLELVFAWRVAVGVVDLPGVAGMVAEGVAGCWGVGVRAVAVVVYG